MKKRNSIISKTLLSITLVFCLVSIIFLSSALILAKEPLSNKTTGTKESLTSKTLGTEEPLSEKTSQTKETKKETTPSKTQEVKIGFWRNLWCRIINLFSSEGYKRCVLNYISGKENPTNKTAPSPTPSPTPTPAPSPMPSGNIISYEDSPFGFGAKVDGSYSDAVYIGVKWSREFVFGWTLIQPDITKNEYKFKHSVDKNGVATDYDAIYLTYSNSLHYVLVFGNDPAFAGANSRFQSKSWAPLDASKLTNYAKTIVERYDGDNNLGCSSSVHAANAADCYAAGDNEYPTQATINVLRDHPQKYWQIGNEPTTDYNGNGYSDFARAISSGIKQADQNAIVVIGGIYGYSQNYADYVSRFNQLTLPIIQQLNGCCIDVFEFHWYGDAVGQYRFDESAGNVYSYIRSKLNDNGFSSSLPIWIIETSSVSGTFGIGGPKPWNQTEQQQAFDYVKRFVYYLSQGVKKIFPAPGLMEGFDNVDNYWDHAGLIYDGIGSSDLGRGVKKLGYYSYKLMTDKLEGSNWNNIETLSGLPSNVYAYKFLKNSQPVWVVWWDYWNSPSETTKQVTIPVTGITGTAKITQSVPHFTNGLLLQNSGETYPSFFDTELKTVNSGQVVMQLGQNPVYVEPA